MKTYPTSANQLFALMKFQGFPSILFILTAFFFPTTLTLIIDESFSGIPSLGNVFSSNLQNYMTFFIFVGVLLPTSNDAFIATRPIDRKLIVRARVIMIYGIMLVSSLAGILTMSLVPTLMVSEENSKQQELIHEMAKGSFIPTITIKNEPYLVTLPYGNIQMALLHSFVLFSITLIWQMMVTLIPSRWQIVGNSIPVFLVLFLDLIPVALGHHLGIPGANLLESLFLWFTRYQLAAWPILAAIILLVETWKEKRYTQMEFH